MTSKGTLATLAITSASVLAKDSSFWHAITQQEKIHQHCNERWWVGPEQPEQAAAKRTLPPLLSFAGIMLGWLPLNDAHTPVAPRRKVQTNKTSVDVPNDSDNHPTIITLMETQSSKPCTTAMLSPLSRPGRAGSQSVPPHKPHVPASG